MRQKREIQVLPVFAYIDMKVVDKRLKGKVKYPVGFSWLITVCRPKASADAAGGFSFQTSYLIVFCQRQQSRTLRLRRSSLTAALWHKLRQ